jgi:hypothetical protein
MCWHAVTAGLYVLHRRSRPPGAVTARLPACAPGDQAMPDQARPAAIPERAGRGDRAPAAAAGRAALLPAARCEGRADTRLTQGAVHDAPQAAGARPGPSAAARTSPMPARSDSTMPASCQTACGTPSGGPPAGAPRRRPRGQRSRLPPRGRTASRTGIASSEASRLNVPSSPASRGSEPVILTSMESRTRRSRALRLITASFAAQLQRGPIPGPAGIALAGLIPPVTASRAGLSEVAARTIPAAARKDLGHGPDWPISIVTR